ncbi:hypothetical protein TNCV_113421 [Trichonephila clavipes]|nr:hypothetical protein TNCV_113421 [Trichonephila clavipes]
MEKKPVTERRSVFSIETKTSRQLRFDLDVEYHSIDPSPLIKNRSLSLPTSSTSIVFRLSPGKAVTKWPWQRSHSRRGPVRDSSTGAPEDPSCRGLMFMKTVEVFNPRIDVVWKFGDDDARSCIVLIT